MDNIPNTGNELQFCNILKTAGRFYTRLKLKSIELKSVLGWISLTERCYI